MQGFLIIIDIDLVVELLTHVYVTVLTTLIIAVGDGVGREMAKAVAAERMGRLLEALGLVRRALGLLLGEFSATAAAHILHLAALEQFQLFWVDHSFLYGERVLPRPLLHLLVHLGNLGWVDGPETALALVAVARWFLDLLEAFVQRQIMPHRVLPTIRRRLKVGEVFAARGEKYYVKIPSATLHIGEREFEISRARSGETRPA